VEIVDPSLKALDESVRAQADAAPAAGMASPSK
jgi:hypothetical protein